MIAILSILTSLFSGRAEAKDMLSVGSAAPLFQAKTDKGANFKLEERKGKWTVLYFYPKDDTPGCTKQACAFRDSIDVIRKKGAEVFGVSKDTVESHGKFVDKYRLNFPILADPEGDVIKAYGVSGMMGFAKRWTFLIDPELKIRWIETDVDPALDAERVAQKIDELKK